MSLTPDQREQEGLKMVLQLRELDNTIGHLLGRVRGALPTVSKPLPTVIPPKEPKG
jgi:hypothetical protein